MMTFDVLLTQKNQHFFAHVRQWPEIIGQGETEEQALAQARNDLKALLAGGRMVQLDLDLSPTEHPWAAFEGMFATDPDWDAFQQALQENRDSLDELSTID